MSGIIKQMTINLGSGAMAEFCGPADENLRIAEKKLNVEITCRGDKFILKGGKKEVLPAVRVLKKMAEFAAEGGSISALKFEETIEEIKYGIKSAEPRERKEGFSLTLSPRRDPVRPKTKNQKEYLNSIFSGQITFGIGPAGTGKTYLAAAAGLYFLREKKCDRIILVRPVVEAGENLGFLPGDLKEKINPYLRPLFDAISEMIEPRVFKDLLENEIIEIAPLAYMRGRTLNRAYVILDEAQNTTKEQMKMFLTRAGHGTKMVINGDVTQTDLAKGVTSGLVHASSILRKTGGIFFADFTSEDVARAPIVKEILKAYEKDEKQR